MARAVKKAKRTTAKPANRKASKAKPKPARPRAKAAQRRTRPAAAKRRSASSRARVYDRVRERSRAYQRTTARSGRDIGELPDVAHPSRRARCKKSLAEFCCTYHAPIFNLPWAPHHDETIARLERIVLRGGLFAYALPRGEGKTSLVIAATEWAQLYGYRHFVAVIGSEKEIAVELLDSVKADYQQNDRLIEDFPEALYPIQALENVSQRASGQLYQGEPTRLRWRTDSIVLPTIPGSPSSGSIVKAAGLTGRIRGMHVKLKLRGKLVTVRPDVALLDDPQTDESARSDAQCDRRESLVCGAVLGLAGPDVEIAVGMPCTIISPGDLADRLTDPERNPDWQGLRSSMVLQWPDDTDRWHRYVELRTADLQDGGEGTTATEYYGANRKAMDRGAIMSWPARKTEGELSALQHAYNLLQKVGLYAFLAEYQNTPKRRDENTGGIVITVDQVAAQVDGLARGVVDPEATMLTSFVDLHDVALFWSVFAWSKIFTGWVIDYGIYPSQRRGLVTLANVAPTLGDVAPAGSGIDGAIRAGLVDLLTGEKIGLIGREFRRPDGSAQKIGLCLVDAGYKPKIAAAACRHAGQVAIVSRGVGVGAAGKPISSYQPKPGATIGDEWYIPPPKDTRGLREVRFDANWWKAFVWSRWATTIGDRGSLALWGSDKSEHRLFAEHVAASEFHVQTSGRGRTVLEFRQRANRPDNHWLDCNVGNAVAASMLGARLLDDPAGPPKRRRRAKATGFHAARK